MIECQKRQCLASVSEVNRVIYSCEPKVCVNKRGQYNSVSPNSKITHFFGNYSAETLTFLWIPWKRTINETVVFGASVLFRSFISYHRVDFFGKLCIIKFMCCIILMLANNVEIPVQFLNSVCEWACVCMYSENVYICYGLCIIHMLRAHRFP